MQLEWFSSLYGMIYNTTFLNKTLCKRFFMLQDFTAQTLSNSHTPIIFLFPAPG